MKRKPAKAKKHTKRTKTVMVGKSKAKMVCTPAVCAPAIQTSAKCPKCGYCHVLLATLPDCPMCRICGGCDKKLMHCRCKEGE